MKFNEFKVYMGFYKAMEQKHLEKDWKNLIDCTKVQTESEILWASVRRY